jgi:hypothetical protein
MVHETCTSLMLHVWVMHYGRFTEYGGDSLIYNIQISEFILQLNVLYENYLPYGV